jgi:hypothetical protein
LYLNDEAMVGGGVVDVFISYKREERARCQRVRDKLRALELDVWFDADLSPDKTFREQIEEAVGAARAVLGPVDEVPDPEPG